MREWKNKSSDRMKECEKERTGKMDKGDDRVGESREHVRWQREEGENGRFLSGRRRGQGG